MSAAATAAQPQLHGLPSLGEMQRARTARFAIVGTLQLDARALTLPDHRWCLQALIGQHVDGHPHAHHVLATTLYPAGAEGEQLAHDLARRLPAGTLVVAIGTGMEPHTHHGAPVLRLLHCLGVAQQDPGAFFAHEAPNQPTTHQRSVP